MNTIQLGYVEKDVVFKNFTKLFEFNIVNLKNYSISPRGGTFEIEQDLITDNTQKIITYCIYQLGNCQFWAFCELTGFSNGYYMYTVSTDAVTTAFKNGVFDGAQMQIAFTSIPGYGYQYTRDSRRMLSPQKTVNKYRAESADDFILTSATQGCVCMQVLQGFERYYANTTAGETVWTQTYAQGAGNAPCNINTYILSLTNFNRLWQIIKYGGHDKNGNTLSKWTQGEQAAYLKSILQVYYIPISYTMLGSISDFRDNFLLTDHIYFPSVSDSDNFPDSKTVDFYYCVQDMTPAQGVSFKAYVTNLSINKPTNNNKFLCVGLPTVTIPASVNKFRDNNMQILYQPYICKPMQISPQILGTSTDTTIEMRLYLDFAGAQYYGILYVNGQPMSQYTTTGMFTQMFPIAIGDSVSNYSAARTQAYISTGVSAIGAIGSVGLAASTGNIAALASLPASVAGVANGIKSISDIDIAQSAAGHIMGAAGTAGALMYSDVCVTISYNDYATTDAEWGIYGMPAIDALRPMNTLSTSNGYLQVNTVYNMSYGKIPKSIVDDAITQLKNGVFLEKKDDVSMAYKKIFLSPSNQTSNIGAYVNTNECEQCERFAAYAKNFLTANYSCEVQIATRADNMNTRCAKAKDWGADIYLAIHTNAFSNAAVHGTETYHHSTDTRGKAFATKLLQTVSAITGVKRSVKTNDSLIELNTPTCTRAYIEVDFHSNATQAAWMVENAQLIGETIGETIASFEELPRKN